MEYIKATEHDLEQITALVQETIEHERWNVENGVVLVYEIMEKSLR